MLHMPVMVHEVIKGLDLGSRSLILDATLGLGGHSKAILSDPSFRGCLVGIDQDESHLPLASVNLRAFPDRTAFIHGNFSDLKDLAASHRISFDGILLDLGIASTHVDRAERGFSFLKDGPLDMRMNQKIAITAADLLSSSSKEELARIFFEYGEEPLGNHIATAVVTARTTKPIRTTFDLSEIIKTVYQKKGHRYSHRHPSTKVFQALRIAINGELDALSKALTECTELLPPSGRIVVISYHSLEDRIVKDFFKRMKYPCVCPKKSPVCLCGKKSLLETITKKPITSSDEEIASNPRSRSAKLRVAEKI